jgi:hypothetical protein
MGVIVSWFCVLFGTAALAGLIWVGMKYYGIWSMKRDEEERAKLQEEWKRRADERKARQQGGAPTPEAQDESGENPPLY